MEKLKTKIKKPIVIIEEKTHIFVFSGPIFIFLAMLVYFISSETYTSFLILISILAGISLKSLSLFYKKKIVVSDKKIYIYIRSKKFISWSLEKDFKMINYSQSFFGKIFNFGTLILINDSKEMYEYYYLNDPKKVYFSIVTSYEKLMKKLDPSFIVSYIDKDVNHETDHLDKITDNNEK